MQRCRVGQAKRSPTNKNITISWWDCASLVPPYKMTILIYCHALTKVYTHPILGGGGNRCDQSDYAEVLATNLANRAA
jgi:hypothetical protein